MTNKNRIEYQFKALIENLPQKVFLKDMSSVYIACNENYARDLGIKPEDIVGKTDYDFFPKELADKYRADDKRVMSDCGAEEEIEEKYIQDGKESIVGTTKACFKDSNGHVIGLIGIFRDITARKQAEEALRESEERFRTIFDNARDGILLADIESKKFYMGNNAICRMLGYSKEEITTLSIVDIHPEKDLLYVIGQFGRHARGDISVARGLPIKRKDGSVFYADINSVAVTVAGKKCLVGFFHDTTERVQEEILLRDSEEKYRKVFQASRDAIMTLEPPTWRFTSGNPATVEMFRTKDEAEFLSYEPWRLSPELQPDGRTSADKAKEMIETAMRTGINRFEWLHKRINGEEFPAEVLLSRVEQGEKTFLHALVRDLTEFKRVEEEKKRALELKFSAEIKTQFTSMVSHELRSPMGAIKEGINIVLEGIAGNINDKQKELLTIAKNNTDRLGRLISNVLDFQKIESGKMEFNIQKNDINEVALEVHKTMEILAKEKNLNLVINVDEDLPKIKFDKDGIIQVFTNLLNNAIKFTEKGEVTVCIKKEDNIVHVAIKDTGPGVKKDDLGKLFLPFEQLDNRGDKKKGGSGLGLAISKDIIVAHKGKIWAESELGKGMTVHVTLPIKE